jgi:hypothetical protein
VGARRLATMQATDGVLSLQRPLPCGLLGAGRACCQASAVTRGRHCYSYSPSQPKFLGDSLEPRREAMTRAPYHVRFPSCAAVMRPVFPLRPRDLRRATWRHAALRAICLSVGLAFPLATSWIYQRVEEPLGVPAAERTPASLGQGGDGLDPESAWLGRVAGTYCRSPVVRVISTDQRPQPQARTRPDG